MFVDNQTKKIVKLSVTKYKNKEGEKYQNKLEEHTHSKISSYIYIYIYIWELFSRTKTLVHNTFCIALHVMRMDSFNFLNFKISNKNNLLSLMDKYYRQ